MTLKPARPTAEELLQGQQEDETARNLLAATFAITRERLKLSQRDASIRMGVSQSHVCAIESGKRIRLSTLQRYARAPGGRLVMTLELDEEANEDDESESMAVRPRRKRTP